VEWEEGRMRTTQGNVLTNATVRTEILQFRLYKRSEKSKSFF
jgi:hypothetical protein